MEITLDPSPLCSNFPSSKSYWINVCRNNGFIPTRQNVESSHDCQKLTQIRNGHFILLLRILQISGEKIERICLLVVADSNIFIHQRFGLKYLWMVLNDEREDFMQCCESTVLDWSTLVKEKNTMLTESIYSWQWLSKLIDLFDVVVISLERLDVKKCGKEGF